MRQRFALLALSLGLCLAPLSTLAHAADPPADPHHPGAADSKGAAVADPKEPHAGDAKDSKPADAKGHAEPHKGSTGEAEDVVETAHQGVKYTLDVEVETLSKFDLLSGTVAVEYILGVHCDREPCKPDIGVLNGKETGKPELIKDPGKGGDALYKKYRIKAELDAEVDTSEFPFDRHELPIVLYEKRDSFQTTLAGGHVALGQRAKLAGWHIDEPKFEVIKEDVGDGQTQTFLRVDIEIQRPAFAQAFKTLVPVLFMLLVAAVGLFLRPKSIGPRFAASTAGLVPLVMFHVGQVGPLPPSALTRFDRFMVAAYVAFFAHIVFNTLIMRSEEVKNEARSASLHKIAAIAVPGLTLVLTLLVFFKVL